MLHTKAARFAALRPFPYVPESWTWEDVAGLLFWNRFGAAVTVILRNFLMCDSVDTVENWVLRPFPTCSGTLSFSDLFPVVFSVLS